MAVKEINKIKVGDTIYEIKPTSYVVTTDSVGSASAGTTIPADDITAWSSGTLPNATVTDETLTLTFGTLPSLSYTAKNIPTVSVTSKTVVIGVSEES